MIERNLILVRHGQSEWNEKNLFTGWENPGLTDKGMHEAKIAGSLIKNLGIKFDYMFTSALIRAQLTGSIILENLDQAEINIIKNKALNERFYGDLQGLNKDATREQYGAEQVHIWRRSYDVPPPNGESLELTANRTIPYLENNIIPQLSNGKNLFVAAHGNSLRSIIMSIESLTKEEVLSLEVPTGVPIIYQYQEGSWIKLN